jgi:hypothetical protein
MIGTMSGKRIADRRLGELASGDPGRRVRDRERATAADTRARTWVRVTASFIGLSHDWRLAPDLKLLVELVRCGGSKQRSS